MELVKWDNIRTQIETSKDFDVLNDMRDKLKAYETLAKQRGESLEVKNKVGEYLLRADRKLGLWLKEHINHDGTKSQLTGKGVIGVEKKNPNKVSLEQAGIDKQKSHLFQNMASLPDEKFEEILQDFKINEEIASESIMLNTIKKIDREVKIQETKKGIEEGTLKLPEGKYEVIVIDPPWKYHDDKVYDADGFRGTTTYPTMEIEQIKNIDIPATEDCVLWLWTTHRFIFDCREILEQWGFRDVSILTWVKNKMGIGRWLRSKTEYCIMAVKGKPLINLTNQTTVLIADARQHSRKPDEFYKLVNELCIGRKLDYFSREKREGWDSFGAEIKKFNKLKK